MNRTSTIKWASNCFWFSGVITFLGLYFSISLMWIGLVLLFLTGFTLAISAKTWSWLYQNPLFFPLVVLASAMFISILLAPPYPFKAGLGKTALPFVVFLFSWLFSEHPQLRKTLLRASIFLSFLFAIVSASQGLGLFQKLLPGLNRYIYPLPYDPNLYLAVGLTRHHTTFGFTLIFLFHVLFAHGLLARESREKTLLFLAAFFSVFGILFTFSRGTWLALILSSCFVLILVNWKRLLVLLVLLSGFTVGLSVTLPAFWIRISSFKLSANQERFELWKVGWKMFQKSPWFGQGYDSFGYRLPQFSDLHINSPTTPIDHPHNMYLEFLATSGVVGFLCFFFFMGTCFRFIFTKVKNPNAPPLLRPWYLASAGVLTAFSVGGFFDRYFDLPHTVIPTVLAIGICTASKPR